MVSPRQATDKVQMRSDGIIYVERVEAYTDGTNLALYNKVVGLSKRLREQQKPVLILNRTHQSKNTDANPNIMQGVLLLDFDRLAVYGASLSAQSMRDLMIRANAMDQKVVNFSTKQEALAWLLSPLSRRAS